MKLPGTTCTAVRCPRSPTIKHTRRGAPLMQGCSGGWEEAPAPAKGRQGTKRQQESRRREDDPHGRMVLLYLRFRWPPGEMPCVGLEGTVPCTAACPRCWVMHRATQGQRERVQLGRAHEILAERLHGTAWELQHEGVGKNIACFRENTWVWGTFIT